MMDDTEYIENILTKTPSGLRWTINFCSNAYRLLSTGVDEKQIIDMLRKSSSSSGEMQWGPHYKNIDWERLYHNLLKLCEDMKDDYIGGRLNYIKVNKFFDEYRAQSNTRIVGAPQQGDTSDCNDTAAAEEKGQHIKNDLNLVDSGFKKCSYCAEIIRSEAIYCRYCKRDLL